MDKSLFSSERVDWNTPSEILDLVRVFSPIGLDPCSNANSIVKASTEWSVEAGFNGLMLPWSDYGLVYCNPPYGKYVKDWSLKIREEASKGVEIIALLPSRTDTAWMQTLLAVSDVCLYWKGRLVFLGGQASAPFPSAVLYFGPNSRTFSSVFGPYGMLMKRVEDVREEGKDEVAVY